MFAAADPYDNISLADLTVPLEAIKPSKHEQQHQTQQLRRAGSWVQFSLNSILHSVVLFPFLCKCISGSLLPVTAFDKHSLRVLFTFARDCPPSRPDVLVVIISMLSSAPIPVTNIRFQAAVPKVGSRCLLFILVKDQGDSGTPS